MGFWWYGTAVFVHTQIIILLIALFPFPTPRQWKWLLELRIFNFLRVNIWTVYLTTGSPFLIKFVDSIFDLKKYSDVQYDMFADINRRNEAHVLLLKAQRNFFLSGAAVVLSVFVPRIIGILKDNAELSVKNDNVRTAMKTFRKLIDVMEAEKKLEARNEKKLEVPKNETTLDVSEALVQLIKIELEKLNKEHGRPNDNAPLQRAELEELFRNYDKTTQNLRRKDEQVADQFRPRLAHPNPNANTARSQFPIPRPGNRFGL